MAEKCTSCNVPLLPLELSGTSASLCSACQRKKAREAREYDFFIEHMKKHPEYGHMIEVDDTMMPQEGEC